MNNNLVTKTKKYLSNHKNKSLYRKIFNFLAIIVVFCTVYALIMPAITMEDKLICEVKEHVHNENCYTDNFICEDTDENKNDETCYELKLICEEKEHIHNDNCYSKSNISDKLNLTSLDEGTKTKSVLSKTITSYTTLKVYAVNYYGTSYNTAIIAYSSTSNRNVETALGSSGMGFTYWDSVVVSYQNGKYIVTDIIASGTPKNTLIIPQNGFIILANDSVSKSSLATVTIGSVVTSDFSVSTKKYNTAGIGTLSFESEVDTGTLKPSINNKDSLNVVLGADTRDLIEVNLYDYGTKINSMYRSNSKYPGFQQGGGTKSISSLNEYAFNYGDNITAEIDDIVSNVTHNCDITDETCLDINTTNISSNNGINRPISGVMNKYLIDDYPALQDGSSLKYLFTNNTATSTTKKNDQSINGLFQYNETTGAYFYNSRENHAEFNASNDTFTLYKEILTSNFMMYPFGNFLPFNSIVTQATKASTINKAYFDTIADSALYKTNNGYGNSYATLSKVLNKFGELMDSEYGTGWDAGSSVSAYFKYAVGLADIEFPTKNLENVYSIDYDEATDFFFGLEMKMNFMQPKNGLTGLSGKEQMKFYFTGDDDVWVYIDDTLFLDLSGIHRHVGGEIDFYNGVVNYYDLDVATGDVSTLPTKTVKFSEILGSTLELNSKGTFENYSTHTFNFYYMERGSGSGVMRMNFNMPLLKKNTISVTKELTVDDGSTLGNPDFKFQILNAPGGIKPVIDIPFIGEGVEFEIYNQNGVKLGNSTVLKNGIFTLKAGQTAVFSNISENAGKYYVRELIDEDWASQYKAVSVDGKVTTSYNDITIGVENFSGIETDIKDASNGNTYFDFNNKVDTNKFGTLKLIKNIEGQSLNSQNKDFYFTIKVSDQLLPIGTTYEVKNAKDGSISTRKVLEKDGAGVVVFKPYEEVRINNILVGSSYQVVEIVSNDYTVSYQNNIGTITKPEEVVTVTIVNTEKVTNIEIPFKKFIENSDGNKYTNNFKIAQIVSLTDQTELKNLGNVKLEDIVTSKDGIFSITYSEPDYNDGDKVYYKVSEISDGNSKIEYDKTIYILEVTIDKNTNFQANITKIIKVKDEIVETVEEIIFANYILTDLIISKEVQQNIKDSGTFTFKINATYQDKAVSGVYKKLKNNIDDGEVTFANGTATIYLKHNEKITIVGLPYGMAYEVSETTTDGYVVEYQVNPVNSSDDIKVGNTVSGNLGSNNHIKFINIGGYSLPATGSSGMLILIIIGSLLLIIPIIYIGYMFYKIKR